MLISPVSAKIGNTPMISLLTSGMNVILIVVDKPADRRPDGTYSI